MSGDPEAVTRALHALYHRKKADRECQYANPERCRIYAEASRDASVLASLPDDRLAEAEAKVRRVEELCDQADADAGYVFDGAHNYGAKVETPRIRAALSGGDAA